MKAGQIAEVVRALTGPIMPVGETREDELRYESLETMIRSVDILLGDIDRVLMYSDDHRASVSKAAKRVRAAMTEYMRYKFHEPHNSIADMAARQADAMAAEREKRQGEGWIEWHGGECPVPNETIIDFVFRNGEVYASERADEWDWKHHDIEQDIVKYRIVRDNNDDRWYSHEAMMGACKYRDDRIFELEQQLKLAKTHIGELVERNDALKEKNREVANENEQFRKRDIRNYIPHPRKWKRPENYFEVVITKTEARQLYEDTEKE